MEKSIDYDEMLLPFEAKGFEDRRKSGGVSRVLSKCRLSRAANQKMTRPIILQALTKMSEKQLKDPKPTMELESPNAKGLARRCGGIDSTRACEACSVMMILLG